MHCYHLSLSSATMSLYTLINFLLFFGSSTSMQSNVNFLYGNICQNYNFLFQQFCLDSPCDIIWISLQDTVRSQLSFLLTVAQCSVQSLISSCWYRSRLIHSPGVQRESTVPQGKVSDYNFFGATQSRK